MTETLTASDHYLKTELYSRVRADSEIFEFLQAGSLDGIWYLDLENPGCGWMSARYKELFGYQDHEIPNDASWWRGNVVPEDLPPTLESFARHCADPRVPFDQILRHRHKDGSIVWVRCRGLVIRDESGKPIRMIGAHTDITAFKRTEERLRALYQASPEMSFLADLETREIIDCNQTLRENCGGRKIIGSSFLDLWDADSVAKAEAALDKLRAESEVKDIELRLKRKLQPSLPVLLSAQTVHDAHTERPVVRAWCRDISHLKQVANIEVLIGTLPGALLLADKHGLVCSANTAADVIFGYEKGALRGKALTSLFSHPSTVDNHAIRADNSTVPINLELNTIELGDGTFQVATIADLTVRKGIETALQDSEHRFRQLTESLPQLVWTCAADGNCDYLSPQWVQYTGVSEEEQLRLGWLHQVHPDDRDGIVVAWTNCIQNESPLKFDFRIRRYDGLYRWFDTRAIPLRNSEHHIVKWFGSSTDITELKHVEADQRFLLQLGADLQSSTSPQAIAELSTRSLARHFQTDRCSLHAIDTVRYQAHLLHVHAEETKSSPPEVTQLSGWSTPEMAKLLSGGITVAIEETASHSFTADAYIERFQRSGIESLVAIPLRRQGAWVSVLCLLHSKPRHWSPREIDLARTACERTWLAYEAARALAAERSMHATLAAGEQRLQLALQSANIGIWENDRVAGTSNWDARSRIIFGFPPDLEIHPELVMSCVHPDDRQSVEQSLTAALDPAGPGHFTSDYRIKPWNGTGTRHVYAQGQIFFEGEGNQRRPVRSIGMVQDVTALKEGEQALRRANLELERFAYAAAHDLQEPLRNVALASQILASRHTGKFDSDADSLLKVASDGAIRMQEMVKDLLSYSRALALDEGTVLFADANVVLSLALQNLTISIEEKQAQISYDLLAAVRMSELHLMQVFQNLISNSLKYSGSNQPRIHITADRSSGECVFSVRDNGIGIPPEHHERAFGVFKRLHRQDVAGTGIGLALCKRIVEHYGGRIWIESDGGHGTTILFTPPMAEASKY